MVPFVGDLHQPLHDEDNGDKAGNDRHVVGGRPDNLHWVWDTGLLEHINRNPEALATELESKITPQDRAEWQQGAIDDWVLEGHRLAQTVAYGHLRHDDPTAITPEYEKQADPVIEMQLEEPRGEVVLPASRGAEVRGHDPSPSLTVMAVTATRSGLPQNASAI